MHPHCLKGLLAILKAPTTESFANTSFNGLHAYYLVDADGTRHAFRYHWIAVAGPDDLTIDEGRFVPPQYLVSEMKQRIDGSPAIWDLEFEMAEPGDPTDDMTKHWPKTRRRVKAGRLVVDRVHEDQDLVDRSMFDPTKVPPGIEVSADPVLHFRSESYVESQKRRLSEDEAGDQAGVGAPRRPRRRTARPEVPLNGDAVPRHETAPPALDAGPARPRPRDPPEPIRPRPAALRADARPDVSRSTRCRASSA